MNNVFYANSGSEANDTIIRMVRHFWALEGKPEKRVIIGRTMAIMAAPSCRPVWAACRNA
jgi:putrescine aminotransferase